ncbi:MAG: hypothetical protein QOI73_3218 [Solirubrobacteraceae bacterium]|nr:hypothetical protein [Solirubrobacteraceae bacterium]
MTMTSRADNKPRNTCRGIGARQVVVFVAENRTAALGLSVGDAKMTVARGLAGHEHRSEEIPPRARVFACVTWLLSGFARASRMAVLAPSVPGPSTLT